MTSTQRVQSAMDHAHAGAEQYAGQDPDDGGLNLGGPLPDFYRADPDPAEDLGSYGNEGLTAS